MRNVRSLACICLIAFLSLSISGKSELCESTDEKQLPKFKLENVRPLTDGTTLYMRPLWSPDGSKISFTKRGNRDILVVDPDGREKERVVAEGAIGWDYAWSPDGRKIAYRVHKEWREGKDPHFQDEIRVVIIETGEVKILSQYEFTSFPAWTRNDEIVYTAGKTVGKGQIESALYFIDEDGNVKKTIDSICSSIRTSFDGNRIAYTVDDLKLRITAIDKQLRDLVARDDARYLLTAFSPDGTKLAVKMGNGPCVIDIESKDITKLDDYHNAHLSNGCWSPDGQWLVYHISYDDGHRILASDLYLIRSDGTQKIRLTNTEDSIEMGPYFSPDGESIVFWTDETGIIWRADLYEEVGE